MKYKQIDPTLPRFTRTKYQTKLKIIDLYQEYKAQTGSNIDSKTFRLLYEEMMAVAGDLMATERNGVMLPEQMGNLHLAFFKMKRKSYNNNLGMRTGRASINHCLETESLQGKIYWDFKEVRYRLKEYGLYGFIACRNLKRKASNAFTTTPELFRKYIYIHKANEIRKARKIEKDERNNSRSPESIESTEQGS